MILVADEIPPETRRIIEFLNGQMDPAEILAVEIRQFVGPNGTALVPRVVGQTEKARERKTGAPGPKPEWDEAMVLAEMEKAEGPQAVAVAKDLVAWAGAKATTDVSGGRIWGSINVGVESEGEDVYLFRMTSKGTLDYGLGAITETAAFETPVAQGELLERLNRIPGTEFPPEKLRKYPARAVNDLIDPVARETFKRTFEWIIEKLSAD